MSLICTIAMAVMLVACRGSSSPAKDAAEAAYTGQLRACVDKATTLAESKACRAEVDRAWGIVQTPTDGGAP